ncbi:MAG TPA: HEAT repeat domain-containing protein [bacterium]|nr:HEAT repeat domain-containing protein [bacterium]
MQTVAASGDSTDTKNAVRTVVDQIRAGVYKGLNPLQKLGPAGVPAMMEWADDRNDMVRAIITQALYEIRDERAIPVFVRRLDDSMEGTRGISMHALSVYPLENVKSHLSAEMLDSLSKYAQRFEERSYRAVLLIGDLGDTSKVDHLRALLSKAKTLELSGAEKDKVPAGRSAEDRMKVANAPAVKGACLKVLLKMGDREAEGEVVRALREADVSGRVFAVEAIQYAGKDSLVTELLPLLNDGRKVMRVSKSANDFYFLTVRDKAINAIAEVGRISPPFEIGRISTYTDEQVKQVKAIMRVPDDIDSKYPPLDDGTPREEVARIVERIRGGQPARTGGSLSHLAKTAPEALLEYINDENPNVRGSILHALSNVKNPNVINALSRSLDDDEPGIAAIALDNLFQYPRDVLQQHCDEQLTDRLVKISWRWSDSSVKALLLLSDLDRKEKIPELLKILQEANSLQAVTGKTSVIPRIDPPTLGGLYKRGIIDDRLVPFPKVKSACLKALFKMGTKEGEQSVLDAIAGDDIDSRVFAMEAIEYASRKDLLKNLLPLLDDNRDAVPGTEFMGIGTTFIKVRSLAVNTIGNVSGVSFSFKIGRGMNYTDAQVAEVREFLKKQ